MRARWESTTAFTSRFRPACSKARRCGSTKPATDRPQRGAEKTMKAPLPRSISLLFGIVMGAMPFSGVSAQQSAATDSRATLTLVQRIPLPNVTGRMDHLGIDISVMLLFAAALGDNQNTVEVIDIRAVKRVSTIRGQSRPQGVFYSADF